MYHSTASYTRAAKMVVAVWLLWLATVQSRGPRRLGLGLGKQRAYLGECRVRLRSTPGASPAPAQQTTQQTVGRQT